MLWTRSLRWRLQAWQALILLAVVSGFGTSLYLQVRRARFDEIDAELLSGARVLEGVLRTFLPPGPGPPGMPRRPRRPPGGPPPFRLPPPREALHLPGSLIVRHEADGEPPYYAIRRPDGEVLRTEPMGLDVPPDRGLMPRQEWHARRRGVFREVTLRGPGRTTILVGRPIGRELSELQRLGWRWVCRDCRCSRRGWSAAGGCRGVPCVRFGP